MADTTALKNKIRAAIKANDNQEITGPVLQQALLDMVDELNGATETEAQTRQNADSTLQQNINTEAQQRQNADSTLQQNINTEAQRAQGAEQTLQQNIDFTNTKINVVNFIGKGDTWVETLFKAVANRKYKILLHNINYSVPTLPPGGSIFEVWYFKNNAEIQLINISYSQKDNRQREYSFELTDDFLNSDDGLLHIGGRAVNDENVYFTIIDVTEVINIISQSINNVNNKANNIQEHLPFNESVISDYSLRDGRLENGKYIPSTSSGSKYTDFIPVSNLKSYRLVTTINTNYDCAVWFLRNAEFGQESYIGEIGYVGVGGREEVLNEVFSIPNECNYIVFGVRNINNYNLYERELVSSASDVKVEQLDAQLKTLVTTEKKDNAARVLESQNPISSIYTAISPKNGCYYVHIISISSNNIRVSLCATPSKSGITTDIASSIPAGDYWFLVDFNSELYIRIATINDNADNNVSFAICNSVQKELEQADNNTASLNGKSNNIQEHLPYDEVAVDKEQITLHQGYLEGGKYTPSSSSSSYYTDFISVSNLKSYKLITRINTTYDCAVWFLRNAEFGQESYIGELGYVGSGGTLKDLTIEFSLPIECNYIVIGTRLDYFLYERTIKNAASEEEIEELRSDISDLPSIADWAKQPYKPTYTANEVGAVAEYQDSSNAGKQLYVGNDGRVTLGTPSEPLHEYQNVFEERLKTIYLGANLINSETPITLGQGWSGTLGTQIVVAQGTSNSQMSIDYNTGVNKLYLISFSYDFAQEGGLYLQVGDEPAVDVYNGTIGNRSIGVLSKGGVIKFIEKYAPQNITFTNFKIQEVTTEELAYETLTLNVSNISTGHEPYSVDAYWNVAIGPDGTMHSMQNGTRNIAIGYQAEAALKSGTRNIAIGTFSLHNLESGDRNIAIGADALWQTSWAEDCVSIGKESLGAMHFIDGVLTFGTMKSMTAVGQAAMAGNPLYTEESVGIGDYAGHEGTSHNVSIGSGANYYLKGEYNTIIGHKACPTRYIDGEHNTIIGADANNYGGSVDASHQVSVNNAIAIGYQSKTSKSNQIVIGNQDNDEILLLGNKRIIFHQDKTVTWEEVLKQAFVTNQYMALPTISGTYNLKIVCQQGVELNVTLNTSGNKSSATTTIVNGQVLTAGEHIYSVQFNGEAFIRIALINDNIPEGVYFEIYN